MLMASQRLLKAVSLLVARALPQAIQVADRWHLMENASRGFLDAVRRSMRQVREVVGAAMIDPALLTAEGEITKLKLVKRQMYGRGKIDLLQARLIGLTSG